MIDRRDIHAVFGEICILKNIEIELSSSLFINR